MLNNYEATLRPAKYRHHLKKPRLCSCCREPGHTINLCDDPRINTLYEESMRIYGQYSDSLYTSYLGYVDINVVKALCLRLGMAITAKSISRNKGIQLLITYFNRTLSEQSAFIPFPSGGPMHSIKLDVIAIPAEFENIEDCTCPACYTTDTENMIKYECNHFICCDCFIGTVNAMSELQNPPCALCRKQISKIIIQTENTYTIIKQAILNNPRLK